MHRGIVVVIGTGGTIAGQAARADDAVGYRSGVLDAQALVAAVPPLAGVPIEAITLARGDSCDMDHSTWLRLREALQVQLGRREVVGAVVTHGTDTVEETAYFLHRTLDAGKPVVLTAAMRPATALGADGPANLLDAVSVARSAPGAAVVFVFGGQVYGAADLRKVHGYRVDAFSAGDAGVVAALLDGELRRYRDWPVPALHAAAVQLPEAGHWPAVDIVVSHAGARGAVIDALVAAGAQGIVIAGTGNGTVHRGLAEAARRAEARGVTVRRASRCQLGGVVGARPDAPPAAGALTALQARIELLLDLIAQAAA